MYLKGRKRQEKKPSCSWARLNTIARNQFTSIHLRRCQGPEHLNYDLLPPSVHTNRTWRELWCCDSQLGMLCNVDVPSVILPGMPNAHTR